MTRIGSWPEGIQKGPLCVNCGVNRLDHDAYPGCDDFVDPTPERPDAAPPKEVPVLDPVYTRDERRQIDEMRSRLNVANAIASARIEQHLTQEALGKAAGTKQSRISEIEDARGNLRFDTLDRIATALGLMVVLVKRPNTTYFDFNEVHGLAPPPSDAAQLAAVKLLALKDNWDSYGARIISKIAVDAALRLRNVLAAVPSFVPTSSGGVQIEWHSQGFDVELEIEPNGRLAHPPLEQADAPDPDRYPAGYHHQTEAEHLHYEALAERKDAPGGPWETLFWAAWQVVHNRLKEIPVDGSLDPDMDALWKAVNERSGPSKNMFKVDRLKGDTEGETDG